MRRASLFLLSGGLFFLTSGWGQTNSCDLNGDGVVNDTDVNLAVNMSLQLAPCTANIAGANVCNVVVVQRVANAKSTGICFTSTGIHGVSLTWTASTSSTVTGYRIYRGTSPSGLTQVASLGKVTSYVDNGVVSGVTYYYSIRATDGTTESADSNQAQAVIPVP